MHGRHGLPKNAPSAKIFMMAAADQGYAAADEAYAAGFEAIEYLKLLRACAACGAPDASRTCMGCRTSTGISMARYCTPECQKQHWTTHKRDCGGRKACKCRSCVIERGDSSTSEVPA